MFMNNYILVIKLYQPLLNSHSKCKLQKFYDLCDHAISNSILWISLAKSIIMNVSLFISVSYSNSFDKYILKYYNSYIPCVFVSDKVAHECCAQRRVTSRKFESMIGRLNRKSEEVHKNLYWELNKMLHHLCVLPWFWYCQKGHLIIFSKWYDTLVYST